MYDIILIIDVQDSDSQFLKVPYSIYSYSQNINYIPVLYTIIQLIFYTIVCTSLTGNH